MKSWGRMIGALAAVLILYPMAATAASEPASWPTGSPTLSAPAEARLYLVAFSDRPANEVADEVLGGMLKLPFKADADLGIRMSLKIDGRLTPAELLTRFERALKSGGGELIRRDGLLVIAKSEQLPIVIKPKLWPSPEAPRQSNRPALPGALLGLGALWAILIGLGAVLIANRRKISFGPAPVRGQVGAGPQDGPFAINPDLAANDAPAPASRSYAD